MMEPDTTQAIEVIRQGNLVEGAKILSQVLKTNPEDELAWLWMSACVNDQQKKVYCLQKVIGINPSNQAARKGLAAMGISVPMEERQPVHPDESSAFSYRDLSAAFGGHGPAGQEPETQETISVPLNGGSFADAVKQMQAQMNQPNDQTHTSYEGAPAATAAPAQRSVESSERAMMLEDFGFGSTEAEAIEPPAPVVLEPVEPQARISRRRRGKNNVLLGIIILLLVLLLVFVLIAKFVMHVI